MSVAMTIQAAFWRILASLVGTIIATLTVRELIIHRNRRRLVSNDGQSS